MGRHWDWWGCLSPRRVVKDLGLGHGAAVDVGYALRHWERIGYAVRVREHPACYYATSKLIIVLYWHGCLERTECDSNSACGLIGTKHCPFLKGYGGAEDYDADG